MPSSSDGGAPPPGGRVRRRLRWPIALLAAGLLLVLLGLAALALEAARLDVSPAALVAPESLRLLDRSGQELGRVRDADGELLEYVPLEALSPWLVPALLAAEDKRFFSHPGVDPIALVRALGQALWRGRVISGASTLTQQLARTLFQRPRTLLGKWRELALALRLERSLDKSQILEAYFNRVHFGPRLRGVGAASHYYFDKPAQALSLAEAAALVAVVRGPTRYDPERSGERLRARRDAILGRMLELGSAERGAVERAVRAPLTLHEGYVMPGAFHFVRAAVQNDLPRAGTPDAVRGEVRSTLDGRLQTEVESAVRSFGVHFAEHRASAAAVLVVDNARSAVRAYVGSPDYGSRASLGQNDGVLALRQPGSTLKPFVYALGMRDLGLHAASLLSDLERSFESSDGSFSPQNYDRRFHGPVRLAAALAASLNVPAVSVAERLGPARLVTFLQSLGFAHLDASTDYGPGIALGSAEVQLLELTGAYATLARLGEYVPLRFFETDLLAPPRRVLPASVSRQITDILSDPGERAATFGRDGPLEFDVPVAVKTGTSKGNRDNWVVGFTSQFSVGVWVGNFDGSPMLRSSGATGAGPLFHAVMAAVLRGTAEPVAAAPAPAPVKREICAASGQLAGPACPDHLQVAFWTLHQPTEACTWHQTGLEVLPAVYAAWGEESGRFLAPRRETQTAVLPSGPRSHVPLPERQLALSFPRPFARFILDSHVAVGQQQIVFSARAAADASVSFSVDGRRVCVTRVPFKCPWSLVRGDHDLGVWSAGSTVLHVPFSVR